MFQVAYRAVETENWNGEIVWVAPLPWVFFIQGLAICVVTLAKWRGNPSVQLLLRLLDDENRSKVDQGRKTDSEIGKT